MEFYNIDFHIHGPFAGGTSKNLSVEKIAEMGYYKGLNISPVGDLTHKGWFDNVFSKLQEEENCFYFDANTIFGKQRTNFILSTEVQVSDRTHHLILFPDKRSILDFKSEIKQFGKNFDGVMDGRPWLKTNAEQIAKICVNNNLLFGPAHAFTPYFGVYAHYNSLVEAYGEWFDKVSFLELGLSADSYLANNIAELKNVPFLSNSDAHSFWPHRLGREFNRFLLEKPNYFEIEKALKRKDDRKIILNAGLNPKEGIYHLTKCKICHQAYTLDDAVNRKWKCVCGGTIKKGVKERIEEISKGKTQEYNRPKYKYLLPLAEIIAFALSSNNPLAEKVQRIWWDYIKEFKTEINILVDASESDLIKFNSEISKYIVAFRNDWVVYRPGGGGEYGKPIICFSEEEKTQIQNEINDNLYKIKDETQNKQRKLFG